MKNIIITTQSELDALPKAFAEFTLIKVIGTEWIKVEARENSKVVARENSKVKAWGNSSVYHNAESVVLLFSFAVCFLFGNGKAIKKAKTATLIKPKRDGCVKAWLEQSGITPQKVVTLFKRVSGGFKTREGTPNETLWNPGTTVEHKAWNPKANECGDGKFHACPIPYLCDEFRSGANDRYVAIQIRQCDLYAWPNPTYHHKIAFRKGTVLYECDRNGNKI